MSLLRALVGGVACLASAVGCAGTPEPALRWVDDTTFVAPRSSFFDSVATAFGQDAQFALRAAAALDHNCPLEDVLVARERRMTGGAEARFVVRVCGAERVYLDHGGAGFIDVTAQPASDAAEPATPAAPTGLDTPTSPPESPKPKEPTK